MLRRFAIACITVVVFSCAAQYEPQKPVDCNKVACTCEQDPEQPQCIAIKTPDGGLPAVDGGASDSGIVDAGQDVTETDAADAEADADAQ